MGRKSDDFEEIHFRVSKKVKRILEVRRRRGDINYKEMFRPAIKALVEDTERLFGHLDEFKKIVKEE
jgi:hypothetical protein